jgi:hypothetical protein
MAGASRREQRWLRSDRHSILLMRSEQVPEALSGVNERELQKEFDVIAGALSLCFLPRIYLMLLPSTPQLCSMT